MKVSIFDVAKKSGLSVVTVSRVINNSKSVREKNRQKVLQAMKELDYHPSAAARSLARGKTGVIGLIITTLHDSFLDDIVKEITDCLQLRGYFLALSISQPAEEDLSGHYLIQEDRVDGLFLLSTIQEDRYVAELKKRKIPFVLIDNQQQFQGAPSVVVDNFKGGYDATRHLIDLGHSKIAHLGGQEYFQSSRERKRGYMQAMQEAGLAPYLVETGHFAVKFGYESAIKWIQNKTLPTAVFAGDDYIAFGLINAFWEHGIRVPEDVSIVGYDDQEIASEVRPNLTTVRQPAAHIGKNAVDLLMDLVEGSRKRNALVKLEPELIVRASTMKYDPSK